MNAREVHLAASVAAAETRERLEIDTRARVDVFEAIVRCGLKLMFQPLGGFAGFYQPPDREAGGGVLVNSLHPLALQRYSAAHELGHHVFEHGRWVTLEAEPLGREDRRSDEERVAEAFAAWFLMAPEAFAAAATQVGAGAGPSEPAEAYAIALRLGVSYRAICTHLVALGRVPAARADRWAKLAPKALKQALSVDPPPGGWRNDVWLLGAADAGSPIVVRSGDRLMVDGPGARALQVPSGLTCGELPARDLLGVPRLCVDIPADRLPGAADLVLERNGEEHHFALVIERPRRGRYLAHPSAPR